MTVIEAVTATDPGRLVLWLGDHASDQLDEFSKADLRGVALSLAGAHRNQMALAKARERGFRITLDPELWRNQLASNHPKRKGTFRNERVAIDIEEEPWNPFLPIEETELNELAHAAIESQVVAGGTGLVVPGHVYEGAMNDARRNDLKLAARCLEVIDGQMLRTDPKGNPRTVKVQINLDLRELEYTEIDALIKAYADFDVDGYWVNIQDFTGSIKQFRAVKQLAKGLAEVTEAEVTVAGLGRLWPGALATGIDSVCFGHQHSSFPAHPENMEEQLNEDQGLGVTTYHEQILGAVRIGPEGEWTRLVLFQRYPCDCGHHPRTEPPRNKSEQVRHNAACAANELAWATSNLTQEVVSDRIRQANETRARVGVKSKVNTGWSEVYVTPDDQEATGTTGD